MTRRREIQIRARIIFGILLVCYILLLVYIVFFMMGRKEVAAFSGYRYNLVPFQEIDRFYHYRSDGQLTISSFFNLIGNVVMFIPFGVLVPIVFEKTRGFFRLVGLSFLASLAIELCQLYTHRGVFDVDDLILNTIGGAIGAIISLVILGIIKLFGNIRRKRKRK